MNPTVDLVYFDAGGGHRAAAQALQAAIAAQQRPWQIRLVNLTQVLDPDGSLRRRFGFDPEQLYNRRLQRGWTFGLAQELRVLQGVIRLAHPWLLRTLRAHWAATEPDLVVSLVPNFNRALNESVASALPGVPYVTVMTDLADHPPHFWIEPGLDVTLVCGTAHAAMQARKAGLDATQVRRVSGMLLHPRFDAPAVDAADDVADVALRRAEARAAHGLNATTPAAVVMYGGHGSRQMLTIAQTLPDTPMLLLCGRNEALAERLRALRRPAPHAVFGFTQDVPGLMRLGDFFIGKPGPGSLSEALHMGLPVVTMRNSATMPQERFNTHWVQAQRVGCVVSSIAQMPEAVRQVVERLDAYRAAARALDNRANREVPEILAELLARAARPGGTAGGTGSGARHGGVELGLG